MADWAAGDFFLPEWSLCKQGKAGTALDTTAGTADRLKKISRRREYFLQQGRNFICCHIISMCLFAGVQWNSELGRPTLNDPQDVALQSTPTVCGPQITFNTAEK